MTVNAGTSVIAGPFTPNGVTTVFAYDFRAYAEAEVVPILRSALGGTSTPPGTIVIDLDAKTVTITPALDDATDELYIVHEPTLAQSTDLEDQARFSPEVMELALDKGVWRDKWLASVLDRAVLAPIGDEGLDAGEIIDLIDTARETSLDEVEASVQTFIAANLNFHAKTLAFNEAATDVAAQMTIGRMELWDKTYRALLAAGFFTWATGGFMVGESKAQTLVNFVDPALAATESGGTLTFLADRYVGGSDPAAAYIDSNYTLPAAGFLQDSATLWVRTVEDVGDDDRVIGTSGGKSFIVPTTDQNHVRLRLNSNANIDSTRFTPNGAGDWALIRPDASTILLYRGDDLYETFTDTSATVAGGGNRIIVLGAGGLRTTGKIAYAVWGIEATEDQYTAARAILEAHAREIGAVP